MKYVYHSSTYCNKRGSQLTFNMSFKSKGGRLWLVFGIVMKSLDDIKIVWCNRSHYLKRLSGFIEVEEYKEYIEEIEIKSKEFYRKYFKEL